MHLALNWLTGHWILAAIAAIATLVCCVPAVGGPLLKAMFTTRPGLVATTVAIALGVGSWYGSDRYAAGVHYGYAASAAKVAAASADRDSWKTAATAWKGAIDAQDAANAQAQADAVRDQRLAMQAISAAAVAELDYKRRRAQIDAEAAKDKSQCAATIVTGLE